MSRYTFLGTPVYFEFLAGKRDLTCSAWAIPTRNIRGWKGPCYLMTDGHYSSYAELLEKDRNGTDMASSTAWRATAAARIAWCIAATSRRRRWDCKRSAETRGKRSNSISARNRNLLRPWQRSSRFQWRELR